jgi:hypothetical protein
MIKDYSEEVKELLNRFITNGFEFGKPIKLLSFKSGGLTEEQIKKELFNFDFLEFSHKQEREKETRYLLYFIYSKKNGRAFVITFREKIRIITIFPLGEHTLKKYYRNKFKKKKVLK